MRVEEIRFGKKRRIGGDQRYIMGVCKVDKCVFGSFLNRVIAPAEFDIQTIGKQRL